MKVKTNLKAGESTYTPRSNDLTSWPFELPTTGDP